MESKDTVRVPKWGAQGNTTGPKVLRHPRAGLNDRPELIKDRAPKPRQGIGGALRRIFAPRKSDGIGR